MRNRLSAELWTSNAILQGYSRIHYVHGFCGPLSIKSVVRNEAAWKFAGRDLLVRENSFLVLNDGEPYSLTIDAPQPVETCCVFFQKGFVESLHASLDNKEIEAMPGAPIGFLSRLHVQDSRILPRMRAIAAVFDPDALWLDEQFLLLARDLLALYREGRRQIDSLPALRPSTKEEIYKRLCRGREYLHAEFATGLTLAETARAACLSPYHFHRAFKKSFGITPHQYVTGLRLDHARHLLMNSERSITDISLTVGFESPTSFANLFRRRYGAAPSAIRRDRIRKSR